MYKYNAFTGTLDITRDSNVILQEGATYATPTSSQLETSITYVGYNYPSNKRPQDVFIKTINAPILPTIDNITSDGFRVNWLIPTWIDEEGNTQDELVNSYLLDISESSTFASGVTTISTTALNYTFTSLTSDTIYYVRVRAVQEIQPGLTEKSDYSPTANVQVLSDLYLALSPFSYLDGTSLTDLGTLGGTWTEQGGTVDFTSDRINLDTNEYLTRQFTPALPTNLTQEDFTLVLVLQMNAVNSTRPFMSIGSNIFTTGSFLFAETVGTNDIRFSRTGVIGGTSAGVRTGTEIKVVIRSIGTNNFELVVNPTVGGELTDAKITLSRGTLTDFEYLAIGGRLLSSAQQALGIPYIKKFAMYRNTIPTYDEIANLPI